MMVHAVYRIGVSFTYPRPLFRSQRFGSKLFPALPVVGSDDSAERRAERLMKDIELEFQILNDFAESSKRLHDRDSEVSQLVESRRHWPDDQKLTPEEASLVESLGVDALLEKYAGDLNDEERIRHQFHALLICKTMNPLMLAMLKSPLGKKIRKEAVKLSLGSMPSVHPAKGFPDEPAVLAHHRAFANKVEESLTSGGKRWVPLNRGNSVWDAAAERSPFGPVSSSACYEELGLVRAIQLKELFSLEGRIIPGTKIFLNVIENAIVSPSQIVTTVVQDDSGQAIALQIHNMKNLTPSTSGIDAFPIGSRFYLRNPFLKLGRDGWLLLRVDQPFDLERLDLPPMNGNILVVGDGDFSFSAALAKANRKRGSAKITASSLDSYETVKSRYHSAAVNLEELSADPNAFVKHELDATLRGAFGAGRIWDSIVWNFPYPEDQTTANSSEGRSLLVGFFYNLNASLKQGGRAYVTLATKQGGTTREAAGSTVAWDVESLALDACLEVVEVLPFIFTDFDGYEPRRAYSDQLFPVENARIHILRRRQSSLPGDVPSERSPLSRMASFVIDRQVWGPLPTHIHVSADEVIESLAPFTKSSKVARRLWECATAYKQVLVLLSFDLRRNMDFDCLLEHSVKVTDLLNDIFSTDDDDEAKTLGLSVDDATTFTHIAKNLYGKVGSSIESTRQIQLANAIFVTINMGRYENRESDAMLVDVWLSVLPRDPWHYYCRASINVNFLAEQLNENNEQLRFRVIDDCYKVLDLIDNDKSNKLYLRTVYIMAFAFRTEKQENMFLSASLYDQDIELADATDRQLPAAHYHAGFLKFLVGHEQSGTDVNFGRGLAKARFHYQHGLSAEKNRLPFFSPVVAETKAMLAMITMVKQQAMPRKSRTAQIQTGTGVRMHQEESHSVKKENDAGSISSKRTTAGELELPSVRFTAGEVRELLEAKGDIYVGEFPPVYKLRFGKNALGQKSVKLKSALEDLSRSGEFIVEARGKTEYWLTLPRSKPRSTRASIKVTSTALWCTASQVWELLQEAQGTLYVGDFKGTYTRQFGKVPFANGVEVKKALDELSRAGKFKLANLNSDGQSFWITLGDD